MEDKLLFEKVRDTKYKNKNNYKIVVLLINTYLNEMYQMLDKLKDDGLLDSEFRDLALQKHLLDIRDFIDPIVDCPESIEYVEDHKKNVNNLLKVEPASFTGLKRLIH